MDIIILSDVQIAPSWPVGVLWAAITLKRRAFPTLKVFHGTQIKKRHMDIMFLMFRVAPRCTSARISTISRAKSPISGSAAGMALLGEVKLLRITGSIVSFFVSSRCTT